MGVGTVPVKALEGSQMSDADVEVAEEDQIV